MIVLNRIRISVNLSQNEFNNMKKETTRWSLSIDFYYRLSYNAQTIYTEKIKYEFLIVR